MANAPYDHIRVSLMTGAFDWRAQSMQLVAWAPGISFIASDKKVSDIKGRGGTVVGNSYLLVSMAVASNGMAQSGAAVFPGVAAGLTVEKLTLVKTNAVLDNRELILFLDDVYGLPWVSNNLELVVQPDWALGRGWWRG